MKLPRNLSLRTLLALTAIVALLALVAIGAYIFIVPAALISSNLASTFNASERTSHIRVLEETTKAESGEDASFWLNSGGWAHIEGDTIKTVTGSIPSVSYWRLRYRISNPLDTDNGYHPQNVFRLITTTKVRDSEETVYARILAVNESQSPNRNESNGILLMSRFVDGDNLYYAGIRVDGYAVIKRKRDGRYETLALSPLWTSPEAPYHRSLRPNLIPEGTWIGLKLTTRDRADGSVELSLYIDTSGVWELVTSARDHDPLPQEPLQAGIRSDFMDAEFKSFTVREWEGNGLTPPLPRTEMPANEPEA